MNMKRRGWGVENRKHAVGAKGTQTNTVQEPNLLQPRRIMSRTQICEHSVAFSDMVQMSHYCNPHMNMKQRGLGVEI